ncbi:hypothetical protein J3E72DRAFT_347619 [Bipolaris maydis]|uniref:uncharacterized protein n=1 Tax=Cochliobolus heterostrophus TaxID=5016 RepID=UPI0024D93EFB|nr:hypothetical protein J3E74DRAFT_370078 [Bipolaris maydis]KAJ6194315.1 hypothetical protein J3E72DRAFT_347619 [Bipolaris maydis]KAJ6212644.1 hypothetical protein PSV09DRAFT_2289272 [Bipolaris maydis]KAJ6266068.1 hypothetical protein PSV08DRAFT_334844 [Bipolaris maydis]KAJ6281083.1 hypothetical protein J3E71DRAFT_297510 [Bipolaris maydis]
MDGGALFLFFFFPFLFFSSISSGDPCVGVYEVCLPKIPFAHFGIFLMTILFCRIFYSFYMLLIGWVCRGIM